MRPEQWEKVEELFAAALEQSPELRRDLVVTAAAGDREVIAEVESLLAADASTGTVFDQLDLTTLGTEPTLEQDLVGGTLGPYRVDSEIGSGGMGTVYLAHRDDDEFDRRVAIKVVTKGLSSEGVLQRFRAERQILANLDHPNIARMLEGGTTDDGRPYLVMEHIDGKTIDEHCDQLRLSVRARVELVRAVCDAVQYAHQAMVVHRDLKPNNIMITSRGEAKLLDFGIAKLLDPISWSVAVDSGRLPLRALTPAFASPEQLKGKAVTTASDVFSLGAVLHLLLSGQPPDRSAIKAGTIKVSAALPTCEAEVAELAQARGSSPARLRRGLSGDLDSIVAGCLAFEPNRRYSSIGHLADDLDRYLRREAISVRTGRMYRSGRLLQQHWRGVTAIAMLFCSLLSGLFLARHQAQIADTERARAERHLAEVRQLANTFLFELHDVIAELPGSTAARELVVSTALDYLNLLSSEDPSPELLHELAIAWERVGDAQGNPFQANLGHTGDALASYRRAYEIRLRLARHRPSYRRDLAGTLDRIGDVQTELGDLEAALASYRQALEIRREFLLEQPLDVELRRDIASNYIDIGDIDLVLQGPESAAERYNRARTMFERLATEHGDDLGLARSLSVAYNKLAGIEVRTGSPEQATDLYRRAYQIRQRIVEQSPDSAPARRDLSFSLLKLADNHAATGEYDEARELYRRAVAIDVELVAADPDNYQGRRDLSVDLQKLANAEAEWGDPQQALDTIARALELRRRLMAEDPSSASRWRDLASVQLAAAEIHLALALSSSGGNARTAREHFEDALESLAELEQLMGPSAEVAGLVKGIHGRIDLCDRHLR